MVRSCAHWGVFGVIRGHWINFGGPWGSRVHSATLGPFGCTLGVVGGRSVNSGAPYGSLGSFRVVGFIRVRPSSRRVNSGVPLASLVTFGVGGFIQVHSGVVGFILVRWVH